METKIKTRKTVYIVWRFYSYEGWGKTEFESLKEARKRLCENDGVKDILTKQLK